MRRNFGVKAVTWLMAASMFFGGIPSPASIVRAEEAGAPVEGIEAEYSGEDAYAEEAPAEVYSDTESTDAEYVEQTPEAVPEQEVYTAPAEETVQEPVVEPVVEQPVQEEVPAAAPEAEVPAEPVVTEPAQPVETVTETVTEEPVIEEPAETAPEADDEEAEEEEEEPEEAAEELVEPKPITIYYVVDGEGKEGGRVSAPSESVDLNDDEDLIEGSTAYIIEGEEYRYEFTGWYNDGTPVTSDETLKPNKSDLEDDITYTAQFDKLHKKITVTYTAEEGGHIIRLRDYDNTLLESWAEGGDEGLDVFWLEEDSVEGVKAVADEGYKFLGWISDKSDGAFVLDENYAVNIPKIDKDSDSIAYTAKFEKLPEEEKTEETEQKVSVIFRAGKGGSIALASDPDELKSSMDLKLASDDEEEVIAVAEEGFAFEKWTKNGEDLTEKETSITVKAEEAVYEAVFAEKVEEEPKEITITFAAGEGGQIALASDPDTLLSEIEQVITDEDEPEAVVAVPADDYVFSTWEKDGEYYSDSEEITVDAEAAAYTANFVKEEIRLQAKKLGAPRLRAAEMITVTFDPTTDPNEPLEPETIEVAAGNEIGDQLPAVPEIPGYTPRWVIQGTETVVTAETIVTEPFTAVVDEGEKITYTVTFVQEDGTEIQKSTDIDDGFAVNDLPEVTPKTNKIGKWVYPGTTNEFTVGTVISKDLTVEAYYEQNIFTVKYMVDGAQYEELTTATGTTIVLPTEPVKDGATFIGWFTEPNGEGTQYTATSTVDKDLTLYAFFEGQVRVNFIVKDKNGNIISEKSQYFVDLTVGDRITTLPDDPFIEGEVFDHWENENNEETVEAGYQVTESFNAIAVFKSIDTYELTVNYFYMNGQNRVEVSSQVFELTEDDLKDGYTVTAPGYTIASEIEDDPTYYPSQPTITVTKNQFTKAEGSDKYTFTVEDEFVAASAEYIVKHYLKDLTGDGFNTLIGTVEKVGVKNSKVTPDINNYAYAEYDHRDENVTITGASDPKQELNVYYTRRNFTLSYNVGGGDYIEAVTKPYGTSITLPTNATRAGYTFAGWYKDEGCTQEAGTSITLEDNTTLYAKWNAAQVDYKIVYMVENANDTDYSYLATVTKQAATGSSITMTAQTAGANGTRPSELDTTNFTFKDSSTETVLADGTTVVIVRYSRNVYTLQGRYDNRDVSNAKVTAKYGADITSAWGSTFGSGNNAQYSWSYNNNNDSKFKSLTIMPSLSVRTNSSPANTIYLFRHTDTKEYYQHLEYWLQNYTDGDATTTYNGKTYGRVKSIDMRYGFLSDVDDWYDIAGYTKAGYTATASETQNGTYSEFTYSWGTLFSNYTHTTGPWYYQTTHYDAKYTRFNFYYDAKDYPLTFYNYDGTVISDQYVTLGNNIYSYLTDNIPAAPMEGATWLGWYTDQEHTAGNEYAYTSATTMPAGLVLYAAFQFPTRTVTYDSQDGSAVAPETDEYGFYAKMPENPTKDNYKFQGWFTAADETGSPYDWNQPVTQNITLYAHWVQNTISYTVHYYEKETTTKVLDDKVVTDPDFTEGQSITENAPTVAGHVADEASKTIELSFDEENNTIIFYYDVIPNEIKYTVNYVLQGTEIKVAKSKTVTVPGSTTNVMEKAVEVDAAYLATQTEEADILGKHYKPTEATKELQLALANNVITFEYVPFTTTKITVNYLDMDENPIADPDTAYVEKGDTYTVQNKAPAGFIYHHAYLDGTTTAPEPTYQITGDEGNIVINIYYQKKLIIIANNKSKAYDGIALVSSFENTADYEATGLARGDRLTALAFDGSQTNAGTSATTPKDAQITLGTTGTVAPEQYYSIIYVPGSLTVKPISVYINISADQWNTHSVGSGPNYYTGQVFNVGFTNPNKQHFNDQAGSAYVSITSGRRDIFKAKYGDAIWSALYGSDGALISEKNAGTYTVTGEQQRAKVAGITVDGQAMMSDPNYSIVIYARDSFLKIEPLPLTITTPSAEKNYDGTPLTQSEGATLDHSYWTANIGGEWTAAPTAAPGSVTLGTGDKITFEVTGSQTPVGSSENTYSIDWGSAKSSNYKVTATLGTLGYKWFSDNNS